MLDALIYCSTKEERDELFELLRIHGVTWASGRDISVEDDDGFNRFPCFLICSGNLKHATLKFCESKEGKIKISEGPESRYHISKDRYMISLDEYLELIGEKSPRKLDFTNLELLL